MWTLILTIALQTNGVTEYRIPMGTLNQCQFVADHHKGTTPLILPGEDFSAVCVKG